MYHDADGDQDPTYRGRFVPPKNDLRITIPDDLPYLEHDPFDWTQEELDDAADQAKAVLFSSAPVARRVRAAW